MQQMAATAYVAHMQDRAAHRAIRWDPSCCQEVKRHDAVCDSQVGGEAAAKTAESAKQQTECNVQWSGKGGAAQLHSPHCLCCAMYA